MATALISALTGREGAGRRRDDPGRSRCVVASCPSVASKRKCWPRIAAAFAPIVLPARNRKDLFDVPEDVREALEIVFVEHMEEVLNVAFPGVPGARRDHQWSTVGILSRQHEYRSIASPASGQVAGLSTAAALASACTITEAPAVERTIPPHRRQPLGCQHLPPQGGRRLEEGPLPCG